MKMLEALLVAIRRFFGCQRLTTIQKFTIVETDRDYLCRVDPGALVCALHAKNIKVDHEQGRVTFKHMGVEYDMPLLRMKDVKNANGIMNRPRVELADVCLERPHLRERRDQPGRPLEAAL